MARITQIMSTMTLPMDAILAHVIVRGLSNGLGSRNVAIYSWTLIASSFLPQALRALGATLISIILSEFTSLCIRILCLHSFSPTDFRPFFKPLLFLFVLCLRISSSLLFNSPISLHHPMNPTVSISPILDGAAGTAQHSVLAVKRFSSYDFCIRRRCKLTMWTEKSLM
jgi:hypothetical protein